MDYNINPRRKRAIKLTFCNAIAFNNTAIIILKFKNLRLYSYIYIDICGRNKVKIFNFHYKKYKIVLCDFPCVSQIQRVKTEHIVIVIFGTTVLFKHRAGKNVRIVHFDQLLFMLPVLLLNLSTSKLDSDIFST